MIIKEDYNRTDKGIYTKEDINNNIDVHHDLGSMDDGSVVLAL